jgi:hypothetical protein
MADLRRANHLWTSDSIHFRKVLYIPLEKASRARKLQTDYNLLSTTPQEEQPNPMETANDIATHVMDKDVLSTEHHVGTIRRIPASHLSFFPPPSLKDSVEVPTQSHNLVTPAPDRPSSRTHNRAVSSPSLTSILTALPIAASTRDTIIARLSFDSLSSSYSDREEAEHSHDGLELDDVGHALSSKDLMGDLVNGHESQHLHPSIVQTAIHRAPHTTNPSATSQPTPSAGDYIDSSETPKANKSFSKQPSGSRMRRSDRRANLSDSPKAYIPSHPQIRTAQLEPSPEMHLPLLKTAQLKGKIPMRASLLDVDFELQDTQSSTSSRS